MLDFIKNNWHIIAFILGVTLYFHIKLNNAENVLKLANESSKAQITILEEFHKKELIQRDKALKDYEIKIKSLEDNYNKKIQAQQGQQKAFVHQAQPPNQELYSKNICVLCKEQISTKPNTWDYVVISSYKSSTTITAIETAKIYHYHRTCFSTIAGEDFFEDYQ